MSRYQPRSFINNPEKIIPANLVEQFFLTLRTGNLDQIRDFFLQNKNKFSIIDRAAKDSSKKTPFHTILELDEKVANNETKLRILRYLDTMGAALNLPDANNIWPIHLAVQLQDEKIVKFMVSKGASLNVKDSSNNTPLHYAIHGREVPCPKPIIVEELMPAGELEKTSIDIQLDKIANEIGKIIQNNSDIGTYLVHVFSTLMKIPEMYDEQVLTKRLESEVIKSFSDISDMTDLSKYQSSLQQLINGTYSIIQEELLRGAISPLTITPHAQPFKEGVEEGMEKTYFISFSPDENTLKAEMHNSVVEARKLITDFPETMNETLNVILPNIINTIDVEYLDKLIFCVSGVVGQRKVCPQMDYGESVTLTKTLFLLIANDTKVHYAEYLADKILDHFRLLNTAHYAYLYQIIYPEVDFQNASFEPFRGNLYQRYYSGIISDLNVWGIANQFDTILGSYSENLYQIGDELMYYDVCIKNRIELFINPDAISVDRDTILSEPISVLLANPNYQDLRDEFLQLTSISAADRNRITWASLLERVIQQIKPFPSEIDVLGLNNDVFYDPDTQTYGLPDYPLDIINTLRILDALIIYLKTNDFDFIRQNPSITEYPINQWLSRAGEQMDRLSLERYPEILFLCRVFYRLIQVEIRKIIIGCINDLIDRALSQNLADPAFQGNEDIYDILVTIQGTFSPLTDAHLYHVLLPVAPDPSMFGDRPPTSISDLINQLKSTHWNDNHILIRWFNTYKERIPNYLFFLVLESISTAESTLAFDFSNLHQLRDIIELFVVEHYAEIRSIIQEPQLRTAVRNYFESQESLTIFNNLTSNYDISAFKSKEDFEELIEASAKKLYWEKTTATFYLVEVAGITLSYIKYLIGFITLSTAILDQIVNDVVSFLRSGLYYYLPQVFLPGLVAKFINVIGHIYGLKLIIEMYVNPRLLRGFEIKPVIEAYVSPRLLRGRVRLEPEQYSILGLFTAFRTFIDSRIKELQSRLINIIKFHNDVINFLNYHSAYQLVFSEQGNVGNVTNIFEYNLVPLADLPPTRQLTDDEIDRLIEDYRVPRLVYYASDDARDPSNFDFSTFGLDPTPDETGRFPVPVYHSTIPYSRLGIISNSPLPGENEQINFLVRRGTEVEFYEIEEPIRGKWLFMSADKMIFRYQDGFIGIKYQPYPLNYSQGMPPSIKSFLSKYLIIKKQDFIKKLIDTIYLNSELPANDPHSTVGIFEELRKIEPAISKENNIRNIRINVMLAKLVDTIFNKAINYAARQTVSNWVLQLANEAPLYPDLKDIVGQIVPLVRKSENAIVSLGNINEETIRELMNEYPENMVKILSQIEPDPDHLAYTTPPRQFVQYLFNIDYFSTGNLDNYGRCYQVNPKIVKLLITPDNITSKNTDGYTPLHLAVLMRRVDLVKMLTDYARHLPVKLPTQANVASDNIAIHLRTLRQEKIKGKGFTETFKDNKLRTPLELAIDELDKHLNFLTGDNIFEYYQSFIFPFNEILLGKLMDSRYRNNIARNVTMGAPLQLVLFNHLFNLYLRNYRYHFSFQLRENIDKLMQKYYGISGKAYPLDLFQITDNDALKDIFEKSDPSRAVASRLDQANRRKINNIKKQIDIIDQQLRALQMERVNTLNPEQIRFLDRLDDMLHDRKDILESQIRSVQVIPPVASSSKEDLVETYHQYYQRILDKSQNRTYDLTTFYQEAFSEITKDKNRELSIWNYYLQCPILQTSSMIFVLINLSASQIILQLRSQRLDDDMNNEIKTISLFLEKVKEYIELRESLPTTLEDNPLLEEEFRNMVYLINLIITPAVGGIILGNIYKQFNEMDAINIIGGTSEMLIDQILNIRFDNYTLDSYLNDILPLRAIKYYTTIFQNNQDIDKKLTNPQELFQPIINIIKANRLVPMTDDSPLIQNLKQYLFPFLANTYQNFIYIMRLTKFGFEKYLLNTYQLIKIIETMIS